MIPHSPPRWLPVGFFLMLLLWGCTTGKMVTHETLDVELLAIKPEKIGLSQQTFQVKLRITNANNQPIPIAALSASLFLNGHYFTSVSVQKPFIIKSHDPVDVDVTATTTLADSSSELKKIIKNGSTKLDYELKGTARIDLPLTNDIPIKKSGRIDLQQKIEQKLCK